MFVLFRNKDVISAELLSSARLFVIAGPREKFTANEVRLNIYYLIFLSCLCC